MMPLILAVDTSCDETSVAVTRGYEVISSVVSSQASAHAAFGGVVPFLAQRLHAERLGGAAALALRRANVRWEDVDAVAVTYGPGLAPALQEGIAWAKARAAEHGLPLLPVDHMAGHLASVSVGQQQLPYPYLGVLVSGGHTELVRAEGPAAYRLVGRTLDDALGEAYDKVAIMLGLGYPGGAALALLAGRGESQRYPLPVPMRGRGDLDLSYSGLKNAVRLLVERLGAGLDAQAAADVAASFEASAQRSLAEKIEGALKREAYEGIAVAGGVAANVRLRRTVRAIGRRYALPVRFPRTKRLCGDNAGMIGAAAYLGFGAGHRGAKAASVERVPYLELWQPPSWLPGGVQVR